MIYGASACVFPAEFFVTENAKWRIYIYFCDHNRCENNHDFIIVTEKPKQKK